MTPSRLARWALVLLGAGIVLSILGHGTTAHAAGVAIAGVGAVLLVSSAFYAIGEGEDRDRRGGR